MTEREKVLKALEHHKETAVCNGCPYAGCDDTPQGNCPVFDDAITLLREQEQPVEPEDGFPDSKCPNCGTEFVSELGYYLWRPIEEYYRYCPGCGRRVKWND